MKKGVTVRYIQVTGVSFPYNSAMSISGWKGRKASKGESVSVDAFNENGITQGDVSRIEEAK